MVGIGTEDEQPPREAISFDPLAHRLTSGNHHSAAAVENGPPDNGERTVV